MGIDSDLYRDKKNPAKEQEYKCYEDVTNHTTKIGAGMPEGNGESASYSFLSVNTHPVEVDDRESEHFLSRTILQKGLFKMRYASERVYCMQLVIYLESLLKRLFLFEPSIHTTWNQPSP